MKLRCPDSREHLLVLAILVLATAAVMGRHYGFDGLLGHFSCDLYPLLSEGFRSSRLGLPLSGEEVTILDTTPWGDEIHLHQGPMPALIYAAFDSILGVVGLPPFPKVLLFLVAVCAHLFALFRILVHMTQRAVVLPLALTLLYLLSTPFLELATGEEVTASEIDILYANTFLLLAVWKYMDSCRGSDSPQNPILSAVFIACACLSRPTLWAYATAFVVLSVVRRGLRRDVLVFVSIVLGAIATYVVYNAARFGDPFNFGNLYSYSGIWEEVLFTHQMVPVTLDSWLARVQQSLSAWFGSGIQNTTLFNDDGSIGLLLRWNILSLGLVGGAVVWVRSARSHSIELAMLSAAMLILCFYLFVWASAAPRYAIDVWPVLFVLSVGGLRVTLEALEERAGSERSRHVFVALLVLSALVCYTGRSGDRLISLVKTEVGRGEALVMDESLTSAGVADPEGPAFCPVWSEQLGFEWAERVRPGETLRCADLEPVIDAEEGIPPWRAQRSFHRLGIHRFDDGRCFMLFYSGATLRRPVSQGCRVELVLDRKAADHCSDIELYLDGYLTGKLGEVQSDDRDLLLCVRRLPDSGDAVIRTYFRFTDAETDYATLAARQADDVATFDIRNKTPHYRMHEIRINCGPGE